MTRDEVYSAFVVHENDGKRLLFPYRRTDTATYHSGLMGGDVIEAVLTIGEAEQLLDAECPLPYSFAEN